MKINVGIIIILKRFIPSLADFRTLSISISFYFVTTLGFFALQRKQKH